MYDLQKASLWKRISAWMFDAILAGIAVVLFAWALSNVLGYDRQTAALDAAYARVGEAYGVDFNLSLTEYDALSAEENQRLNEAYDALSADEEAVNAFSMVIHLMLLVTSLGTLMGVVLMEFVVPHWLGNGQTLGKKIFGLGVMRQDGVKINGRVLFIRTILGKYTIETMVPMMILMMIYLGTLGLEGTLVILALLIAQVIMLIATQKRLVIHDALASTVVVDLGSQMIFDSPEAKVAYIEKKHAERARRAEY